MGSLWLHKGYVRLRWGSVGVSSTELAYPLQNLYEHTGDMSHSFKKRGRVKLAQAQSRKLLIVEFTKPNSTVKPPDLEPLNPRHT